jgi:hypothetical protein
MPYDEAEPGDPNILVGVSLPGDENSLRDMAYAFAEEFAAMGYDTERLLRIFRTPHYAGAHDAWKRLGDLAIRRIVDESIACFGRVRYVVRDAPPQRRFVLDETEGRVVAIDPADSRVVRIDPAEGRVVKMDSAADKLSLLSSDRDEEV